MNSFVDPLPERKGAGRRNLDLFLSGSKNSPPFFYFEDDGSEELYVRFLGRIFPKLQKPHVVCMGGKKAKQYLADADKHKISPVVIVQDKDFDDIIGVIPSDPRVVTLGRYSFENYLVDPLAIIELAIESKRRVRAEATADLLGLDGYLRDLYESYRPLAALFVLSRRLNLKKVKTSKQPISEIVSKGSFLISNADLLKFKLEVTKRAIAEQHVATAEEVDALLATTLRPLAEYHSHADNHPNAHLCGKHLLPLALLYVDTKLGTQLSGREQFEIAMRLVGYISKSIFDRLRSAIVNSLDNQGASREILNLLNAST